MSHFMLAIEFQTKSIIRCEIIMDIYLWPISYIIISHNFALTHLFLMIFSLFVLCVFLLFVVILSLTLSFNILIYFPHVTIVLKGDNSWISKKWFLNLHIKHELWRLCKIYVRKHWWNVSWFTILNKSDIFQFMDGSINCKFMQVHLTIFQPTITLCKHTCARIMIVILEHLFAQQR
jgi:hypothetical protein